MQQRQPFFGPNAIPIAIQIIAAVLLWHFFSWLFGNFFYDLGVNLYGSIFGA